MAHKTEKTPAAVKPVFGEIAATGIGLDLGGYVGEVKKPGDDLLQSLGGDLKHYEKLLRDEQVSSTFQQRRRAVVSAEWEVEPGGEAAADKAASDFIDEMLRHIRFDAVTDKMLFGVFYGYAVAECLWARDGARIVLDKVKVRKAKRFRFGNDDSLRLIKAGEPKGVEMPERKFWTFSTGADNDDDPYGLGLGYWLYWPVFLKRNGVKFWAIALEKFGMPTAKGTHPSGATPEDTKKLLEAAAAVGTDAAVVMPEGMDVQLIEAVRRAGGDFAVFCRYMDAAIAKVVLSQTMTTDDGSSLSQANVHMDVRQDVVKSDADLVCESLNTGPVLWLTEWNFPGAATPRVRRVIEEPEDLKAASERDKTIHDMGFRPRLDYVCEKYGGGWEERRPGKPDDDFTPRKGDGAQFAEPTADAIEALIGDLARDGDLADAMDPIIGPIEKLAADSAGFEEFTEGLAGLLKDMDADKLAEVLARSQFAARLAGETGAD